MTAQTRATLLANAAANLNDNTANAITPADFRGSVIDIADSIGLRIDNPTRILKADVAHTNDTSVQPWFILNGGAYIFAAGTYRFSGLLRLLHGTTSHTTSLTFAGTATVTWIEYFTVHHTGAAAALVTAQGTKLSSAATAQVVSGTVTTAEEVIQIDGLVEFSTVGTLIPQFNYNTAAPGVTTLTKRGTRFEIGALGDTSFVSRGTWT